MDNQLPNFPVPSQNYIAPNLSPMQMPGGAKIPRFNLNKKWILMTLVILALIILPAIAYFYGQKQGQTVKTALLAQTMNSVNITPSAPTATPTPIPPTPTLAPIATESGTLHLATPAATFKTYANTKYAYSIQFPADWYSSEFTQKTGAAFALSSTSISSGANDIKINAIAKIDTANLSFADYVKVAGINEFKYTKLASIKPIATTSGLVGYETTWTTQTANTTSTSLPITYFEIPSDKTATIEVFLNKEADLSTYEQMLLTFEISK